MLRESRSLVLGLCVVGAALLSSGCSDEGPAGPSTIVGDLYIGGIYLYFPAGRPDPFVNGAYVIVRDGSSTGPVVPGLTVTVNSHALTFDQSVGLYTGVAPNLVSGDNVTISVSDGLGSVSRTVQVPYAPTDLQLIGGVWNTSSAWATNTLSWDNPVVLGQGIIVYLYDYDGAEGDLIHWAESENPSAVTLTVANSALAYYQGMTSVAAIVGQVNYVLFPSNPSGSAVVVLAGDAGAWPTSGLK